MTEEPHPLTPIDWSTCPILISRPDVVSGAWCVRWSRLPAQALWDNWQDGVAAAELPAMFPPVAIEDVHAVLIHGAEQRMRENDAAARAAWGATDK